MFQKLSCLRAQYYPFGPVYAFVADIEVLSLEQISQAVFDKNPWLWLGSASPEEITPYQLNQLSEKDEIQGVYLWNDSVGAFLESKIVMQ